MPTASDVTPLLTKQGISVDDVVGLVGLGCAALADNAKADDWFVSTTSMNDSKINFFFFWLALARHLSAAQRIITVSGRLYDHISVL